MNEKNSLKRFAHARLIAASPTQISIAQNRHPTRFFAKKIS